RRYSGRTAHELRAGDQRGRREEARHRNFAVAPATGRQGHPMTNRRNFLMMTAALAAVRDARAQSPSGGTRIGWITYSVPGSALDAFHEGMRALGYVRGPAGRVDGRRGA